MGECPRSDRDKTYPIGRSIDAPGAAKVVAREERCTFRILILLILRRSPSHGETAGANLAEHDMGRMGRSISAGVRLQGLALAFQRSHSNDLLLILPTVGAGYVVLGVLCANLARRGIGVGSELRQPLGVSIAEGPPVYQMFTLFTTPTIRLWFHRLQQRYFSFDGGHEIAQGSLSE